MWRVFGTEPQLWQRWRDRRRTELVDHDKIAFDAGWARRDNETEDTLKERRDYMVMQLERDFKQRCDSLRGMSQKASATANVVALMIVGFGLLLQGKQNILQISWVKLALLLVALIIYCLGQGYLPSASKAWFSKFEGAGAWAAQVTNQYTYADRLRKDLNIRNRTLQRTRRWLSLAKVLIALELLLGGVLIARG